MPALQLPGIVARLQRSAAVTRVAIRIYRGYKRTQRRVATLPEEQRAAVWEARHRAAAHEIAETAKRLRGLYVKAAQFLGARADLLPEPYIEALSALHDKVPPQPYAEMRKVLRQELGNDPERVFARFDRVPVAAASLAQVHRAQLRDGRSVAVKVQYPDIERLVRLDLRNLGTILSLVHRFEKNLDFGPLVRAIGRLVPLELDFINEGHNTEEIAAALAHRGDVFSPVVVWEYTTRRVLVTEFVDGTKISEVEQLRALGLDPGEIAARAVDIWGEQVLRLRHFHADPHPGNIFVMPDGRLAIIDFGLTARLAPASRDAAAHLCRAAADRNPFEVMAAFQELGFHAPDAGQPNAYMGLGRNLFGQSDGRIESVNVRMSRALRNFRMEGVPGEVLLIMRVLGLLSGLSARLGHPGPPLPAWRKYAEPPVEAVAS